MDLVVFNFVFDFESKCLNVRTYVVHFEFVKHCWLMLLLLLGVHGNGHAFVVGTCGWILSLLHLVGQCCYSWVYMSFGNGHR